MLDDYRSSEEFAAYEALCRGEDTHVSKRNLGLVRDRLLCYGLLTLTVAETETETDKNWVI